MPIEVYILSVAGYALMGVMLTHLRIYFNSNAKLHMDEALKDCDALDQFLIVWGIYLMWPYGMWLMLMSLFLKGDEDE